MRCVVNKPFVAFEGKPPLKRGLVIDSDSLRNGRSLLNQRFLVPKKPSIMKCKVIRPFQGPKGMLEADEVVATKGWRNTDLLIDQRYLEPIITKKGAKHGTRRK